MLLKPASQKYDFRNSVLCKNIVLTVLNRSLNSFNLVIFYKYGLVSPNIFFLVAPMEDKYFDLVLARYLCKKKKKQKDR